MRSRYTFKVNREGASFSYTIRLPDGTTASEGGFFNRLAATIQAKEAIRDFRSFEAGK